MMIMALIVVVMAFVIMSIDEEKEIRRRHLNWKQW